MQKKALLALALFALSLLTCTAVVAYHYSATDQTLISSLTVTPTPLPITTQTASSQATPASTTDGSFCPLGRIGIDSPTNTTYCSTTLTLQVSGQVIAGSNVELFMNYSLDGQKPVPFPIETQPAYPGDLWIAAINGSVTLSPLSEGSHCITVFGDLEANGPHQTQTTVYFTVTTMPCEITPSITP